MVALARNERVSLRRSLSGDVFRLEPLAPVRRRRGRRRSAAAASDAADGAAITLGALVSKPLQCSERVRAEL